MKAVVDIIMIEIDCLEVKQIGVCDKILRDHGVSLGKIKHCVMEVGMKFHATSMEEIMIL